MKILIIGGTGTISSAITRQLVAAGHELWLINRGNRTAELPDGIKLITGDINNREDEVAAKLGNEQFDDTTMLCLQYNGCKRSDP